MRPPLLSLLVAGVLLAGGIALFASRQDSGPAIATIDAPRGPDPSAPETAGLCPWRTPDADRQRFFPAATGVQDETLVLSRQRAAVTRILGHAPAGADNALLIHWMVRADGQRVGAILTRAVRGESGVIEMVLAAGMDGTVVGIRLQRLREPDDVARQLQSPAWLGAFRGKTAHDAWQMGRDLPTLPPEARVSAAAIIEGAHTLAALLEVGRNSVASPAAQRGTQLYPTRPDKSNGTTQHNHDTTGAP
jgi:hypothetical protein